MVLPDGTRRQEVEAPRVSGWLRVLTASVALAGGLAAVIALTSPDPDRLEVTPTTVVPPPDDAHRWQLVEEVVDRVPYGLIEHMGRILLFASDPPADSPHPTGLTVWTSPDGKAWAPEGSVVTPDSKIEMVGSNALGLFAIGSLGEDDKVRAWLSTDGVNWQILMDGVSVEPPDPPPAGAGADRMLEASLGATRLAFGGDARVVDLERAAEGVIALVSRLPDPSRPYEIESFEIWRTDTR